MTRSAMGAPDRFTTPLYTVAEAARYLDVPASTLASWTLGYRPLAPSSREVMRVPVLTVTPRAGARGPIIFFVGLAEGLALTAMRNSGVPLSRNQPALMQMEQELGIAHALASRRFVTDGAEVLYDYAECDDDPTAAKAARDLVVVRNHQVVFNDAVERCLRRLDFGDDGYARLIHLPAYKTADVVVNPTRGFGQPIFARGGTRIEDELSLFRAGEALEAVAAEFGVPPVELEDVVRIAIHVAA